MQNRCLRVCLNVKMKYPVLSLHSDTGIDYLSVRFDLQLLLLFHKYLYGESHNPSELGIMFHRQIPGGRHTRSAETGLLCYPSTNKLGYRRSPLYRGIELWNQLNASCRLSRNKDTFRSKAKAKLLTLFLAKKLR